MKKIIIFVIIFSFLLSANKILAKFPDDLPGPRVMPDSPFYFLKTWYEKIVIFFTFDAIKKAEKYKIFAEKRAYEAKEMIIKGKDELAEKQKELYNFYLNKAKEKLEKALQRAIKQGKEEAKKELEKKVEEIKIKINETIKLW